MKADANPIDRANAAPRCTAKAKRTGQRCKCPAVTGWTVCRVHGAHGGARPGPAHPNYRHGGRTKDAAALRAMVAELARESRELAQRLTGR